MKIPFKWSNFDEEEGKVDERSNVLEEVGEAERLKEEWGCRIS